MAPVQCVTQGWAFALSRFRSFKKSDQEPFALSLLAKRETRAEKEQIALFDFLLFYFKDFALLKEQILNNKKWFAI